MSENHLQRKWTWRVLLASSFIFRVNGHISLNTFENNSVNSAVSHPLLDWQLLTPETNIESLANKVGGMTFWKLISQAFPLSLSLSLSFSLLFLALFYFAFFYFSCLEILPSAQGSRLLTLQTVFSALLVLLSIERPKTALVTSKEVFQGRMG